MHCIYGHYNVGLTREKCIDQPISVSIKPCRTLRFRINEVNVNAKNPFICIKYLYAIHLYKYSYMYLLYSNSSTPILYTNRNQEYTPVNTTYVYDYVRVYSSLQAFSKNLGIYLKRHAYKNAMTEALWKALEEPSGQSVGTIMRHRTAQMGFPIITVYEYYSHSVYLVE